MLFYSPEHDNLIEVLISGPNDRPVVQLNNGESWIQTVSYKDAIKFIVDFADAIESGELVLISEENINID